MCSPPSGAYPRERGGTSAMDGGIGRTSGLSPRARGNLLRDDTREPLSGPIPASAGEPGTGARIDAPARAYPRERGGTSVARVGNTTAAGLSPRARGNLHYHFLMYYYQGPIPASAGEPTSGTPLSSTEGAYPRERGGTAYNSFIKTFPWGLSPRARGNRSFPCSLCILLGPIPASAGEPSPLP